MFRLPKQTARIAPNAQSKQPPQPPRRLRCQGTLPGRSRIPGSSLHRNSLHHRKHRPPGRLRRRLLLLDTRVDIRQRLLPLRSMHRSSMHRPNRNTLHSMRNSLRQPGRRSPRDPRSLYGS